MRGFFEDIRNTFGLGDEVRGCGCESSRVPASICTRVRFPGYALIFGYYVSLLTSPRTSVLEQVFTLATEPGHAQAPVQIPSDLEDENTPWAKEVLSQPPFRGRRLNRTLVIKQHGARKHVAIEPVSLCRT